MDRDPGAGSSTARRTPHGGARRPQGIFIPGGTYYWFENCGNDELIMTRTSTQVPKELQGPPPGSSTSTAACSRSASPRRRPRRQLREHEGRQGDAHQREAAQDPENRRHIRDDEQGSHRRRRRRFGDLLKHSVQLDIHAAPHRRPAHFRVSSPFCSGEISPLPSPYTKRLAATSGSHGSSGMTRTDRPASPNPQNSTAAGRDHGEPPTWLAEMMAPRRRRRAAPRSRP